MYLFSSLGFLLGQLHFMKVPNFFRPLEKQSFHLIHKAVEALKVSSYTIVVIIAEQFSI